MSKIFRACIGGQTYKKCGQGSMQRRRKTGKTNILLIATTPAAVTSENNLPVVTCYSVTFKLKFVSL